MRTLEQAREHAATTRAHAEALSAPRHPFETDMATVSGIRRKPNARADARRWARFDREAAAWARAREAQAEVERLERVEAYRARNAPVAFTQDELKAARVIRTRYGWQVVVRVNKTTVSVATGYSWVDRVKLNDVLEVRA